MAIVLLLLPCSGLRRILQRLCQNGLLARFVIDEVSASELHAAETVAADGTLAAAQHIRVTRFAQLWYFSLAGCCVMGGFIALLWRELV